MADMITKNFAYSEMVCPCCNVAVMDENFMKLLQKLRDEVGPLRINSGYRCAKHNKAVGGYFRSAHLAGKAADIRIWGDQADRLYANARKLGFVGIGLEQKTGSPKLSRYIHVDTQVRSGGNAIWTY